LITGYEESLNFLLVYLADYLNHIFFCLLLNFLRKNLFYYVWSLQIVLCQLFVDINAKPDTDVAGCVA